MNNIFSPAKTSQVEVLGIYVLIFTDANTRIYDEVMNSVPAVLLAAAGVGVGHAVMPDHWFPLAVLSRTRRYRTARVVRLSLAAALTHVVVSVVLGGILVVVGLQFRATVARHAGIVVGGILLVTGVVLLGLDLLGKSHGHSHGEGQDHGFVGAGHSDRHDHGHHHGHGDLGHAGHDLDHQTHEHEHDRTSTAVLERPEPVPGHRSAGGLVGLLVPFGAAASPDLTILPVFLAASTLGAAAAVGSLASFAMATVATVVGLTTASALGARLVTGQWIDRCVTLITALTLIAIGSVVAAGVI
jgi:nickel/cobalt transporter (NicO) family protein